MKYTSEDGFPYYLELVKGEDLLVAFSSVSTLQFLNLISEKEALYSYAPDKWNIKKIVGHIPITRESKCIEHSS